MQHNSITQPQSCKSMFVNTNELLRGVCIGKLGGTSMLTTRLSRRGFSPFLARFVIVVCLISLPGTVSAQTLTRLEGNLPDGTPWEIVVPSPWNGTLLLDLDFGTSQGRYAPLYARGYAGAGIVREGGAGDAQANSARFLRVIDIFIANFGQPSYTIANGRSRGGVTATVMMDTYPEFINGALGQCTITGYIPSYNQKLDHAFAARVLLGLDPAQFAIVNIPTVAAEYNALVARWSNAIIAAQATPEGKCASMALVISRALRL